MIGISGMGFYVPARIKTNEEVLFEIRQAITESEDVMLKRAWLEKTPEGVVKTTGVRERRIAAPEEATSDLAIKAAIRALEDSELLPTELDGIIVATTTPDYSTPATACLVQDKLGATNMKMAPIDINGACSGSVVALRMARGLALEGLHNILVIGSDVISRFITPKEPSSYILFGDGAAAVVVGKSKQLEMLKFLGGGDGSRARNIMMPAGGSRLPNSPETFIKRQNHLYMNGGAVYRFAIKKFPEIALKLQNYFLEEEQDIGLIIPHQANLKIIEVSRERLGYSPAKVFVNIDRYGNTSSPSVLIGLCEACEQQRVKQGDLIALISFGAGMVWESCLIEA